MSTPLGSLSSVVGTAAPPAAAGVAPVDTGRDAALAATAVAMSAQAGVVATLGAGGDTVSLYSPTGVLNSLVQAGTDTSAATPASGSVTPASTAPSLDQSLVGNLSTAGTTPDAGVYSRLGQLQGLPSATLSASWATILNTNPSAAAVVIGDSYRQGIVNSL